MTSLTNNVAQLTTHHWQYLHGRPGNRGELKQQPDDFIVEEELSFTPSGEGEHLFLLIEKQNLNTGFVAQALAKHFGLKDRDVAWAGRKDKFATTRQWFSVCLPGKDTPDLHSFHLAQCRILRHCRHNKKLRLGTVRVNHFTICIRKCQLQSDIEQRLKLVATAGVPNYFGSQRFGNLHPDGRHGNLALAETLIRGESIRKRDKRSMAISALRSWLFNEMLSTRIARHPIHKAMSGDTFLLAGSNSFFSAADIDDTILSRLTQGDILLSAPLWGEGELPGSDDARDFEVSVAEQYPEICRTLEQLGLKQERRNIHLMPQNMTWQLDNNDLTLHFSLPGGCFATSVIRELFENIS